MKDLQREGHIEVQKIPGTSNPADMFTKPLTGDTFLKCRAMLQGMQWQDVSKEVEVSMLELHRDDEWNEMIVDDTQEEPFMAGMMNSIVRRIFLVIEWMKLILSLVGIFAIVQYRCCRRKRPTRTIGVQSQCTYTSVRGAVHPRFHVLGAEQREHLIEHH